jgi:DNA polymerase zeta
MRPIDAVPLIIEPGNELGSFFADPVVVLDFQSLYPSVMIAFNYCYSTCLGNTYVNPEFAPPIPEGQLAPMCGCGTLHMPAGALGALGADNMTASPLRQTSKSSTMFCKKDVRRGILGKMLTELLQTRAMVKTSMKVNKTNSTLTALLDARQCALKLIANVTYGYTAASMSGRMPSVDIADSIVSKAREVLERSMNVVKDR